VGFVSNKLLDRQSRSQLLSYRQTEFFLGDEWVRSGNSASQLFQEESRIARKGLKIPNCTQIPMKGRSSHTADAQVLPALWKDLAQFFIEVASDRN
jgi:hypothetical protein